MRLWYVLCTALLALPVVLFAADPEAIRWQLKKGQTLKYLFKHREVRKAEIGTAKVETTTTTELEWQWTVREIDADGVATLDTKLNVLRFATQSDNFEFQYDSTRGNQSLDDYKKRLINLLDQVRFAGAYTARLRPNGELVEVRGFSKMLDDNHPGMNILDFHALNLRDDTLAWYLQQALGRLPDAASAKDAKWKINPTATLPNLGMLTGSTEFALKRPARVDDRDLQVIDFEGAHALDLDMKWLNVPLKGTLTIGKLSGNVRFDARAGTLHNSIAEIEMKGDLKLGGGNNPATLKTLLKHTVELEAVR